MYKYLINNIRFLLPTCKKIVSFFFWRRREDKAHPTMCIASTGPWRDAALQAAPHIPRHRDVASDKLVLLRSCLRAGLGPCLISSAGQHFGVRTNELLGALSTSSATLNAKQVRGRAKLGAPASISHVSFDAARDGDT